MEGRRNDGEQQLHAVFSQQLQLFTVKRLLDRRLQKDYTKFHRGQRSPICIPELVQFAIDRYNQKAQGEKQQDVFTDVDLVDSSAVVIEQFQKWDLTTEQWYPQAALGFNLMAYYSVSKVHNTVAHMFSRMGLSGPNVEELSELSTVLIFYREDNTRKCIYALSTGKRGYRPFQAYTDFTFARKMSVRLLDPDRVTSVTEKRVLGPIVKAHKNFRKAPPFEHDDLLRLVTTFTVPLKPTASIFGLEQISFKLENGRSKQNIEVEVQQGGLRIRKKFSVLDYLHILDHFDKIYNDEVTMECDGSNREEELRDKFAQYFFFEYVENQEELNKCLYQKLSDCVVNKNNSESWDVCHPLVDDYYKAYDFALKYVEGDRKLHITVPFLHRPSFQDVIHELHRLQSRTNHDNLALPSMLKKVFLSFKFSGKWNDASLMDCFIGELYLKREEGEVEIFFRVNKAWYAVTEALQEIVDKKFHELMEQCMIFDNHEGFLPHPWETKPNDVSTVCTRLRVTEQQLEKILDTEFRYVDPESGMVNNSLLGGEILSSFHVYENRQELAKLLQKNILTVDDLKTKVADEKIANDIWKELTTIRKVGQVKMKTKAGNDAGAEIGESGNETKRRKTDSAVEVINPYFLGGTDEQLQVLNALAYSGMWTFEEKCYNRSYLYTNTNIKNGNPQPYSSRDKSGFILGDTICVDGVELFDILKFVDSCVYLYHVKSGFGQNTRVACSQMINSCRSKFSPRVLNKFCQKSLSETAASDFRKIVRQQMQNFNEEEFKKLFEKKPTIVYAFTHSYQVVEGDLKKNKFQASDFVQINKGIDTETAERIFKELRDQGYLDREGRKLTKFYVHSSSADLNFQSADLKKHQGHAWSILKRGLGSLCSLVARCDLLQARKELASMEFPLKVCQIQQPDSLVEDDERPGIFVLQEKDVRRSITYASTADGKTERKGLIVIDTKSDFNSGFHALFGTVDNTFMECRDAILKRSEFVSELRKNATALPLFLQDLIKRDVVLLIHQAVQFKVYTIVTSLSDKAASLVFNNDKPFSPMTAAYEAIWGKLDFVKLIHEKVKPSGNTMKSLLEWYESYTGSTLRPKQLHEWFATRLDLFEDAVVRKQPEELQRTSGRGKNKKPSKLEQLAKHQQKTTEKLNELVGSEDFIHRYIAELEKNFTLTNFELEMIAHSNGISLDILQQNGPEDGYFITSRLVPSENDPKIVVCANYEYSGTTGS